MHPPTHPPCQANFTADSEGGDSLDYARLHRSLWELADLWCDDIGEDLYHDFLLLLLMLTTAVDKASGEPCWRDKVNPGVFYDVTCQRTIKARGCRPAAPCASQPRLLPARSTRLTAPVAPPPVCLSVPVQRSVLPPPVVQ